MFPQNLKKKYSTQPTHSLDELKKLDSDKRNYLPNKNISATQIKDVQAEIYEINSFLTKEECKRLIFEIKRPP